MYFEELEDVEFCEMETGKYFRAVGEIEENGNPVVLIEKVEVDYE